MYELRQTPGQIVNESDEYIVGQHMAGRSIAVVLRNRYRRLQLDEKIQQGIAPKNMLTIGPTGVGKTEITRRLVRIVNAPFIEIEVTKFTEVGYVEGDVELMVRDLVENAIQIVGKERYSRVYTGAKKNAKKRLARILAPGIKKEQEQSTNQFERTMSLFNASQRDAAEPQREVTEGIRINHRTVLEQLRKSLLDSRKVTIEIEDQKRPTSMANNGLEQMGIDLNEILGALTPKKKVERTITIREALESLIKEESTKLIRDANIHSEATKLVEEGGIILIDGIDRITSRSQQSGGVSRGGVQGDALPAVEGSQVNIKYGITQTDHALFIASKAFHLSKSGDPIPELQGHFPIRTELDSLTTKGFVEIPTESNNALVKQYIALIGTENVSIMSTKKAIERVAQITSSINCDADNIDARRLHTISEKLLEGLLFEVPGM